MESVLPGKHADLLVTESMALHVAISQFATDMATLGQAAEVAGLSQTEFLRELGRRRVPIQYGLDDLAEDWRTVEVLAGQWLSYWTRSR